MARRADQGTGDREDNPWVQPANGLGDLEDNIAIFANTDMMQPGSDLWHPKDNVNSNLNLTNMLTMQAAVRTIGTAQTSSNHDNSFVANRGASRGGAYANEPRGDVAMEQIRAFLTPPFQVADGNIEPQQSQGNSIFAGKGQDELGYVTHPGTPHGTKRARKNAGPSSEEWQKWKPVIYSLYVDDNYSLKVTREEMAKKGFHAEASMYKRRIRDWDWRTYGLDKDSGNSGGDPSIVQLGKRTRGKVSRPPSTSRAEESQLNSSGGTAAAGPTPAHLVHSQPTLSTSMDSNNTHFAPSHLQPAQFTSTHFNPSTLREEALQPKSPPSTNVAVFTHPRLPLTHFNPTRFSMGIPAPMSDTDFDGLLNTILTKVKDLYISYPAQKKWKVENKRDVEEDIHDELLVGVASSLRNSSSLNPTVGYTGFQKALHTLEKVVGVGEGADCGLFSLPVIWVSFLRLVRKQRSDWAREFLSLAFNLARNKFDREHPFVQVLLNLHKIWMKEPDQLEKVVLMAYQRCIADVKAQLGAFNLTYLSLWGDYVVHLDGTSIDETRAVVNDIQSNIKKSEEDKGPGGGPDGDYTLDLFGLTLYVLQSAPTMADEAEKVARELLPRVEQRMLKAGGKLEGDLFIRWKDLMQTLGTFCQEKKDYQQAIHYLGKFLNYEIVDERDTLALEKLEICYQSLGRDDFAKKVWQWRKDKSEEMLQNTLTDPIEGEQVVNSHGERRGDDGWDVSGEEGSSEATVVDQVEESTEENLEENDAEGSDDSEAEIQLVQEQISELKQRLNRLKRARRGKRLRLESQGIVRGS